jgi:PAS domain S-box-containing protein
MNPRINVLLIEKNPEDAQLVKEELESIHFTVGIQLEWVDDLQKGLAYLATNAVRAVLVDLFLPDSEGLDTLHRVLAGAPQIPVIVMTAQADEETSMKALQAGAQDYLIKGELDGKLLTRVIQYAIQRKQVEHDLRVSEEKIQNIIQHSSSVFYSHTPDHILTYVSPQSRVILDCEPEEAMIRWQTFLSNHPINHHGIEATQRAIETGERQPPYELEVITLKGRKIWVLVDESPIIKDGKTISMVGSLTDITERKHAEAALEAGEKRFRGWIENSSDLITVVDLQGIIQYQSPSVRSLLGYAQEEVLGKAAFNFIHSEDLEKMVAHFTETIQNSKSGASAQCRIRHKDGSWRFIEAKGQIYTDEHGEVVALISSRDMTERKRAEETLQEKEHLLSEAQRIGRIGSWSYDI